MVNTGARTQYLQNLSNLGVLSNDMLNWDNETLRQYWLQNDPNFRKSATSSGSGVGNIATNIGADIAMDAAIDKAFNNPKSTGRFTMRKGSPGAGTTFRGSKTKPTGTYTHAGSPTSNPAKKGLDLKGFYTSKIKPNFGWSKGSGIKAFGKNIGKWGNIAGGAIQGIEALGNLQDLNESQSTTDDLIGDILNSANSNPLISSYLTPDQLSLLRQVKRGDLEPETEFEDFLPDDMSDFGDILKDAGLGLAIGGIPGALIGGIGGAVNSGLSGATEDQAQQNAELEMLLQALEDANMQYQSMKRPNLPALGIQSRYQNMYY